jgi:hypothetical protein
MYSQLICIHYNRNDIINSITVKNYDLILYNSLQMICDKSLTIHFFLENQYDIVNVYLMQSTMSIVICIQLSQTYLLDEIVNRFKQSFTLRFNSETILFVRTKIHRLLNLYGL